MEDRRRIGRGTVAAAAALLAVTTAAAPVPAAPPLQAVYGLEAGAGAGFGRAAYDLSAKAGGDTAMSRLEFPLDGVLASLRGSCSLRSGEKETWGFELGGRVALTDPKGLMRDYDWMKPAGHPRVPFSYTESPVQEVAAGLTLEVSRVLLSGACLELWATGGYRFDYLFQSVRGYEGWQYLWNEAAGAYELYFFRGNEEALRYTLRAHAFPLGLELRLAPGARLGLALGFSYAPVYASDMDDHVLRNKLSTASGLGHGALAGLELRWRLSRRAGAAGRGLYLACRVEGLGWFVSTTQTQTWYGDDPVGPGNETGMAISGIGHEISNLELRAGAGMGLSF